MRKTYIKMKKEVKFVKVETRVTEYDAVRLDEIAKKYGFKKRYSLFRWILFAFLRTADPENDCVDTALPVEVIEMFDVKEDAALIHKAIANIRARDRQNKYKRRVRSEAKALKKKDDEAIGDEIREMFAEAEADGVRLEWKPNINKRTSK